MSSVASSISTQKEHRDDEIASRSDDSTLSISSAATFVQSIFGDYSNRNLKYGDQYYTKKDYQNAEYYYKKLRKAVDNGDKIMIADEKIGQMQHQMGKFEEALYFYRKAITQFESEKRPSNDEACMTWYMAALVNCGNVCLESKQYDNTIDHYKKALPIAQQFLGENDPYVLTLVKNYCKAREELAEQYVKKTLYNLAIEHYVEAERLQRPYLQQRDYSEQYNELERSFLERVLRIRQLFLERNKPEQAIEFFSEMLSFLDIDSLDDIRLASMAAGNKRILASILHNNGAFHEEVGNHEDAISCFEKSISIKKALLFSEKDNIDMVEELWKVGKSLLGLGLTYYRLNKNHEAHRCLSEAKDLFNTTNDSTNYEINETVLLHLAKIHAKRNEFDDCITYLKEMVELARRCFGGESEKEVVISKRIAKLQYLTGQYEEALNSYLQILHSQAKIHGGTSNAQVSRTLSEIGTVYAATGEHSKALEFHKQSLNGADDDVSKASLWNKLAETHYRMKKKHEALECYKLAEPFTSETEERILLLNNMGAIYYDLENLPSAQSCFLEASSLCSQISKQDIREDKEKGVLYNMSLVLFSNNSYDEAEEVLQQSLQKQLPKAGLSGTNQDFSTNLASELNCMGNMYFKKKNFAEALSWYQESLQLKEIALGNRVQDSPRSVAGTFSNMASSHLQLGKDNDALHCLELAIDTSKLTFVDDKKLLANIWYKKGMVSVHCNEYEAAIANFQTASKMIIESTRISSHNVKTQEELLIIRHTIALLKCNLGNFEEAKEELNNIYNCKVALLKEKDHPNVMKVLLDLGCVYLAEKKYSKAKDICVSSLESFVRNNVPDCHPFVQQARHTIEQIEYAT